MGSGLDTIPEGHPQTKSVNFAYNHLTTLNDTIFTDKSYKALHKIELFENKISDISVTAFLGLKHLKIVDLSENNITTINAYTFEFNTRLEKLDLGGNQISFKREFHFLVSYSLATLILRNNRIENIFAYNFVGVPKLKNLFLDYNIINYIEPNSFKPMNDLQYLSLAHTGVHKLSLSMFHDSPPRIIDLTDTILADKFEPPLRKVRNEAVGKLLTIDLYAWG